MKNILVTGASGQLGQCFKKLAPDYPGLNFLFFTSAELNITEKTALQKLFSEVKIDYCINCAAYTNVEKAEEEKDKAFRINAEAVKELAQICAEHASILIHFSTDYVFDGKENRPYSETDKTNPINVYGSSKLKGEEYIEEYLAKYFIFRTSWLYSQFGHNFFKTILRKAEEKATLNITTSQTGTPTNANDLARFCLELIKDENRRFGLYHYSNLGEATWYDFALAILEISGNTEEVELNRSNEFKTKAERPQYSVLDKTRALKSFPFPIPHWKRSLKDLVEVEV